MTPSSQELESPGNPGRFNLPGDPSDRIYLIKRGVVKISTLTEEGKEIVSAFLHPGDVFGELAVVDGSPRDHYAEIYEDEP